jgi:hypothetical protein
VAAADIGTASGAFSTMRQLGGAFGVAVLGAAFATTGSYTSPSAFNSGFVTASIVAAGIALAGAVVSMVLPRRGSRLAAVPAAALEPGKPVRAAGVMGGLGSGDLGSGDLGSADLVPGDLGSGDLAGAPCDAAGTAGDAAGATR